MSRKDSKSKEKLELRKLELEVEQLKLGNDKLKQDIRHSDADEKRRCEDQELKRREDRRKESAEIREEQKPWILVLGIICTFSLGAMKSSAISPIVFYSILSLATLLIVSTAIPVLSRIVGKMRKRSEGKR